jgi:hypothetical protein
MVATKRANIELARGINAFSANSQRRKNGKWRVKTGGDKKVTAKKQISTKKWYPADYIPKPLPSAKTVRNSKKTAKLRKSITPGTVLILLSGRFRGKRVVFLKQLPSGLLLVTGESLSMTVHCGGARAIPMMKIDLREAAGSVVLQVFSVLDEPARTTLGCSGLLVGTFAAEWTNGWGSGFVRRSTRPCPGFSSLFGCGGDLERGRTTGSQAGDRNDYES